VVDYHMEVVLLHSSNVAAGPWQQSGVVAVVLVAAQLLTTEVDAAGPGPPTGSPSRPAWRRQNHVTCLLAQVDLVTGAVGKQLRTHFMHNAMHLQLTAAQCCAALVPCTPGNVHAP